MVEDAETRSASVIPKSSFIRRDIHVQRTRTSPAGPRGFADGHACRADQIRVNIVPKKLKDGDNDALTTPLSVTGTAEDLDAELSSTIVGFVGSHLQMKNTLEKAKAEMDAASKAAQAEARAKSKTTTKLVPPKTESAQPAATAKPAESTKPAPLMQKGDPRLCRGGSRSLTVPGVCSPSIGLYSGREDFIARLLLLFLLLLSSVAIRPL